MWHLTPDIRHLTPDIWHVTQGTWLGGEHFLKISAPQLLWFGINSVIKILNERITQWINEWITKVLIEPPQLHQVC